jgi:hypothetical protein
MSWRCTACATSFAIAPDDATLLKLGCPRCFLERMAKTAGFGGYTVDRALARLLKHLFDLRRVGKATDGAVKATHTMMLRVMTADELRNFRDEFNKAVKE